MPIKIRCSCGAILLAPEERIGQTGKCPSCSRSIAVDLSMSKTQEILHKLELEKTQRTQQEQLKDTLPINKSKQKTSLINKLLTFTIYIIFCLLVTGLFLLHNVKDIENAKVTNAWFAPLWKEYKEPLTGIKYIHEEWYDKIFGSSQKPKK